MNVNTDKASGDRALLSRNIELRRELRERDEVIAAFLRREEERDKLRYSDVEVIRGRVVFSR